MKKWIRILFSLMLALLMVLQFPVSVTAQTHTGMDLFDGIDYTKAEEIRVIVDGKQIDFDVAPIITGGRTLVPMRAIFEALGLIVTWDDVTRVVTGVGEGLTIQFFIGSNKSTVNDLEHILDVPAMIIEDRTMVPLRFLSETIGYNVVWNEDSQLILLSKGPIIEWRYAGFESAEPYKEYEYKYVNGAATTEFRYTGTFKEVSLLTLYRKDGSIIPNVPDFTLREYGAEWTQKSSFTGKTWWIHKEELDGSRNESVIHLTEGFEPMTMEELEKFKTLGGYVKIRVEEHLFDLTIWKELINSLDSPVALVDDAKLLDEKVIQAYDTVLRVVVGDRVDGFIALSSLKGTIIEPDKDKIYAYLSMDPAAAFKWDSLTWNRIERELPWVGMTSEMLLVKTRENPDQTSKITTKFSVLELWVYQQEFGDVVYYFDDGVLVNRW